MTRDEIIKGMGWPALAGQDHIPDDANDLICRIKSIVRAAEQAKQEACAKLCESLPMQQRIDVRDQAAAAIRAMGDQT